MANMSNNNENNLNSTAMKLKRAWPYHIFFNTTPKCQPEDTLSFKDLLCPSLGKLKSSLQINFLVDILWLYEQYQSAGVASTSITLLYGFEVDYNEEDTRNVLNKVMPNVKHYFIEPQDIFGVNHSRLAVFQYEDESIRIAIFTANLKKLDWNAMNQSIWLSEKCPQMPPHFHDTDCPGPTGFKLALVNYLKKYKMAAALTDWINILRRADFSNVKVVLITSIPGAHSLKGFGCHALDMACYLKKYCALPKRDSSQDCDEKSWPIIAAVSSLGSYGNNARAWLKSVFLKSIGKHQGSKDCTAKLCLVYPTINNMKTMNVPINLNNITKKDYHQEWLKKYLYQWKADNLDRSTLVPYSKCYCRLSPCFTKMAWFLMTSANLAKSDWGVQLKSNIYVRSWELGILFVPKFYNMEHFPLERRDINGELIKEYHENEHIFPLMFDLPLKGYNSNDVAF